MELFTYLPNYQVQICRPCGFAVSSRHLDTHLKRHHPAHPQLTTCIQRRAVIQALCQPPLLDPAITSLILPRSSDPPVDGLPVYDGLVCRICPFIALSIETIRSHFKRVHPEHLRASSGHPPRGQPALSKVKGARVRCQRFFVGGPQSSFFQVDASAIVPISRFPSSDSLRARMMTQLAEQGQEIALADEAILNHASSTEVSPWLELTKWPRYLYGHSFRTLAALTDMPDGAAEPLLRHITESVPRLVLAAQRAVVEDKINIFDQERINNFLSERRRTCYRPFFVKLQKQTYRRYAQVWQRLLCFAVRTADPACPILLSHRLTVTQQARLAALLEHAREFVAWELRIERGSRLLPALSAALQAQVRRDRHAQLDQACLGLCISLLDHDLRGDTFESVVLGFFAALAIDPEKQILAGPATFTPRLSGYIKVGQLFVIHRAVAAAASGEVEHPADLIDEMRGRFMMHETRSPFSFALRLRSIGKAIQNSTTCLGYISWSEDQERLSYKQLELSMTDLRRFVRQQVTFLQNELRPLLLLQSQPGLQETVPAIPLDRLKDDPSQAARGWNFLQDSRNAALLSVSQTLLDEILDKPELQAKFLNEGGPRREPPGQIRWRVGAVQAYLQQLEQFLERLLLLIHLTAGQPARGTEILSLRHTNTATGLRSIFIENGMVSTVTAYHKGYSITGSTKIIHRYLPREVGEILVHYLWRVLPFSRQLEVLALRQPPSPSPSPFLWPHKVHGSWNSTRLSTAIQREAKVGLKTSMNIMSYRHAAIAISRLHLTCGGFKRDYGIEKQEHDEQATHTTWTASTVYARLMREAPGHVKERQVEFRLVSREWHDFLGLAQATPVGRKRALDDVFELQSGLEPASRRQRLS